MGLTSTWNGSSVARSPAGIRSHRHRASSSTAACLAWSGVPSLRRLWNLRSHRSVLGGTRPLSTPSANASGRGSHGFAWWEGGGRGQHRGALLKRTNQLEQVGLKAPGRAGPGRLAGPARRALDPLVVCKREGILRDAVGADAGLAREARGHQRTFLRGAVEQVGWSKFSERGCCAAAVGSGGARMDRRRHAGPSAPAGRGCPEGTRGRRTT